MKHEQFTHTLSKDMQLVEDTASNLLKQLLRSRKWMFQRKVSRQNNEPVEVALLDYVLEHGSYRLIYSLRSLG